MEVFIRLTWPRCRFPLVKSEELIEDRRGWKTLAAMQRVSYLNRSTMFAPTVTMDKIGPLKIAQVVEKPRGDLGFFSDFSLRVVSSDYGKPRIHILFHDFEEVQW